MTAILSFGGIEAPDFFRTVDVNFSALPPVDVDTLKVAGRNGEYFVKKTYGSGQIDVQFFIKAPDKRGVMYTAEMLGAWLASDEPQPLIFNDKPDRVYYAIVKDSTPIDRVKQIGKGTISFFLPDPCSYGEMKTIPINANLPTTIYNTGTAEMFPKFKVNFKKSSSFLSLVSPDGIVLLGNPATPEKVTIPKYKRVLKDDMSSVSKWTVANSSQVDVDRVQGSFVSNGYSFQVTDWGGDPPTTGNGWYGAAMRRDLPSPIQDFELTMKLGLSSSNFNEMGRIEVYMYDENGVRLGKMQVKDVYEAYESNTVEGWIGDGRQSQIGKLAMFVEGTKPAPKIVSQKVNGKTVKKTIQPTNFGIYNDFIGFVYFKREGRQYKLQVGRMETDGTRHTRTNVTFEDTAKKYANGKLAYVVIHIGRYKTAATPKKAFYIDDLEINQLQDGGTIYNEDIFNAGDQVEIDLGTGEILNNGMNFQQHLDIASDFFVIDGGTETQVQIVSEDSTAEITADVQERFL